MHVVNEVTLTYMYSALPAMCQPTAALLVQCACTIIHHICTHSSSRLA